MQYLIIGDIHGDYTKLKALLIKAGFTQNSEGAFHHPTIQAIFVGDLIDRGEKQTEVLNLVHSMVKLGSALIVMGNHEFNAIGYATQHPTKENEHLRTRSKKNTHQHQAFLNAVQADSRDHIDWIDWFKTLPLFLNLDDFNVIHAFWDEDLIHELQPYLNEDNALLEQYWYDAFDSAHPLYSLLEKLLKGLEVDLPNGISYLDKDGHERKQARAKWWNLPENDLQKIVLGDQHILEQVKDNYLKEPLTANIGSKPIFIGHYWMFGEPAILSDQVVCIDYSAIKPNGKLVGYLYNPNSTIESNHFIYVQ